MKDTIKWINLDLDLFILILFTSVMDYTFLRACLIIVVELRRFFTFSTMLPPPLLLRGMLYDRASERQCLSYSHFVAVHNRITGLFIGVL